MDPDVIFFNPRTMSAIIEKDLSSLRTVTTALGLLAGVALLLTSIGLYGVLAYHVNQRIGEFGIRIALGAPTRDLMALVVKRSVRMVGAGLALGIGGLRLRHPIGAGAPLRDRSSGSGGLSGSGGVPRSHRPRRVRPAGVAGGPRQPRGGAPKGVAGRPEDRGCSFLPLRFGSGRGKGKRGQRLSGTGTGTDADPDADADAGPEYHRPRRLARYSGWGDRCENLRSCSVC